MRFIGWVGCKPTASGAWGHRSGASGLENKNMQFFFFLSPSWAFNTVTLETPKNVFVFLLLASTPWYFLSVLHSHTVQAGQTIRYVGDGKDFFCLNGWLYVMAGWCDILSFT